MFVGYCNLLSLIPKKKFLSLSRYFVFAQLLLVLKSSNFLFDLEVTQSHYLTLGSMSPAVEEAQSSVFHIGSICFNQLVLIHSIFVSLYLVSFWISRAISAVGNNFNRSLKNLDSKLNPSFTSFVNY